MLRVPDKRFNHQKRPLRSFSEKKSCAENTFKQNMQTCHHDMLSKTFNQTSILSNLNRGNIQNIISAKGNKQNTNFKIKTLLKGLSPHQNQFFSQDTSNPQTLPSSQPNQTYDGQKDYEDCKLFQIIDNLNSKLQKQEDKNQELQHQLLQIEQKSHHLESQLKSQLEEVRNYKSLLINSNKTIDNLRKTHKKQIEALRRQTHQHEEIEGRFKINKLMDIIRKKDDALCALKEDLKQSKADQSNLSVLQTEMKAIKQQYFRLKEKQSSQTLKISKLQHKINSQNSDAQQMHHNLQFFEDSFNSLKNEKQKITAEKQELQNQLSKVEQQNDEVNQEFQRVIRSMTQQVRFLQSQLLCREKTFEQINLLNQSKGCRAIEELLKDSKECRIVNLEIGSQMKSIEQIFKQETGGTDGGIKLFKKVQKRIRTVLQGIYRDWKQCYLKMQLKFLEHGYTSYNEQSSGQKGIEDKHYLSSVYESQEQNFSD